MALEDVAKLLSPKRINNAVRFLESFKGGKSKTKEEIVGETNISESMIEVYITKLRTWYMLDSRKDKSGRVHYSLNPEAFHARVDTLLIDPIRNLTR